MKWDKYQSIQCSIYHPYSLLCSFLLCYLERLESCSIFNTKIVGNIWLIPSVLSSKEEGGEGSPQWKAAEGSYWICTECDSISNE